MRTKDIEKLGIDRNFLKACYKKGHEIIKPKRIPCKDTYNENYYPCEYSQEDIEIIWNAYLCRKIGLSFKEIKDLNEGKEVKIRESLASIIQKKEEDIAELQAVVEFIKYIKGIGLDFLPFLPEKPMGSASFKDYIKDYMDYVDKDKKIKKLLNMISDAAEITDYDNVSKTEVESFETFYSEILGEINKEKAEDFALTLYNFKENLPENPRDVDVQTAVKKLIDFQRNFKADKNKTDWEICGTYLIVLNRDSDFRKFYENLIGEKGIKLLKGGIVFYLIEHYPEQFDKNIIEKLK